jgi:hypothetical protein
MVATGLYVLNGGDNKMLQARKRAEQGGIKMYVGIKERGDGQKNDNT